MSQEAEIQNSNKKKSKMMDDNVINTKSTGAIVTTKENMQPLTHMSPIPSGPFVLQLQNDEAISSEEQFQRFVNFMTNEVEETIPTMEMIHQHNEELDVDILCNMAVFDEPLTVAEALSLPDAHKWQEAMNEEEAWCYDGTWTVVDRSPNMSLLTSKWVFKENVINVV